VLLFAFGTMTIIISSHNRKRNLTYRTLLCASSSAALLVTCFQQSPHHHFRVRRLPLSPPRPFSSFVSKSINGDSTSSEFPETSEKNGYDIAEDSNNDRFSAASPTALLDEQPSPPPLIETELTEEASITVSSSPVIETLVELTPASTTIATPSTGTDGYDIRRFRCASYLLTQAAGVGILSGWTVGIFKVLIDTVQHICYAGAPEARTWQRLLWLPLIPTLGGFVVALLRKLGGGFPPGLKDTVQSVDESSVRQDAEEKKEYNNKNSKDKPSACHPLFWHFRFVKKSLAAIVTLGTGCSLGPEGPSVEIGMNLSRLIMDIFPARSTSDSKSESGPLELFQQRRLLLACGAAAGVSAGFNAPIAGAFFALEIMQQAFDSIDKEKANKQQASGSTSIVAPSTNSAQGLTLTASGSISAILLSSVLSALVCQSLLGEHLPFALKDYSMTTPLLELPLYLLLGATSGLSAFVFSQVAKASRSFFDGNFGPRRIRKRMSDLPAISKPALGGLFCGLVGLVFPQILFCGYDTINIVLDNRMLPTLLLFTLLGVKMTTTAVAAGSGLVGGTFAPSLFLGGMVGAFFHNVATWVFHHTASHGTITLASPMIQMADLPAYAMVGSASVLAAVFRAPLTASLLLFELTRDYGVILPLMASSGVASVVGDILERKQERSQQV
jgi:H+/Cl- antiporter ClcA